MRHEPSLDDENILRRAPFSTSGRLTRQEREADAFASMFLTPAWLLALNFERQGWTARDLGILEMSIKHRSGSAPAIGRPVTRWSATRLSTADQSGRLIEVEPKEIKQQLLTGYEPPDWRSDVWLLTERDEGTLIEGGRNDLFVVRLRENSGAGYLWNFDQLRDAGFALVDDDREEDNPTPLAAC